MVVIINFKNKKLHRNSIKSHDDFAYIHTYIYKQLNSNTEQISKSENIIHLLNTLLMKKTKCK